MTKLVLALALTTGCAMTQTPSRHRTSDEDKVLLVGAGIVLVGGLIAAAVGPPAGTGEMAQPAPLPMPPPRP